MKIKEADTRPLIVGRLASRFGAEELRLRMGIIEKNAASLKASIARAEGSESERAYIENDHLQTLRQSWAEHAMALRLAVN